MANRPFDQLDRYLAGELSAPEERKLGQGALDDPELFEALTAAAVADDVLRRRQQSTAVSAHDVAGPHDETTKPRKAGGGVAGFIRRLRERRGTLAIAGLATAAASIVALVLVPRSPSPNETSPPAVPSPAGTVKAPDPPRKPEAPRVALSPIMLTALGSEASGRAPVEFRASAGARRTLKSEGVIVAYADGVATADLGSLDGIEHGTVLELYRGATDAQPAGKLTVARVFRERSTGQVASSGSVQVGDRAVIPPAVQVAAHLEEVAARVAAGDFDAARTVAGRALSISQSTQVAPGVRRRALAELGRLESRGGSLDQAERHLSAAIDDLDAAPAATSRERAEILNELAAVVVARGNYAEADRLLRLAQVQATGVSRVRVLNNLAGVAALRGDLATAEAMYREALTEAVSASTVESDRHAIEKNLEALKTRE